jgi:hypothetical protein
MRDLAMFFSEDRDVPQEFPFVRLVNNTGFGWEEHVRTTFSEPVLDFELLSADINFSLDTTDPAYPGERVNAWGLVHALAALARRRTEPHGSHLPLAWEVRSASPDAYKDDHDATRIYGLLRAMATSPRRGEDLEQCLWREFTERRRATPAMSYDDWLSNGLKYCFVEDLAGRHQHDSDVAEAVKRLLPQWRTRFLESVRDGKCRLGVSLQDTFASLKNAKRITFAPENPVGIPIAGDGARARAVINLFSVFADLVEQDGAGAHHLDLDRPERAISIPDEPEGVITILLWLRELLSSSSMRKWGNSKELAVQFAGILDQVVSIVEPKAGQSHVDEDVMATTLHDLIGRRGREVERGMVFCALTAHRVFEGFTDVRPGAIEHRYRLYALNVNTWVRALKKCPTVFAQVGGPSELASEIEKAMKDQDDHRLGEQWDWMREGLARWAERQAQLAPSAAIYRSAKRNAPGVFQEAARS